MVALHAESVDRNNDRKYRGKRVLQSLSMRRAWIEIAMTGAQNLVFVSLSMRRAWIEIVCC